MSDKCDGGLRIMLKLVLFTIFTISLLFSSCLEKNSGKTVKKTEIKNDSTKTDETTTTNTDQSSVTPIVHEADNNKIAVLPVLYIPSDVDISDTELSWAKDRVEKHLRLTQKRYLELLETETFRFLPLEPRRSEKPRDQFKFPEATNEIIMDLFSLKNVDRVSSDYIFLVFFASQKGAMCSGEDCLGYGGIFNGSPPSVGGGYVMLVYQDLLNDEKVPLQSTIQHELGHAFGMNHVDCHGYDMETNMSMMSYNLSHHAFGLTPSATPGIFIAENYYVIDKNKAAFPDFFYDEAKHNPEKKQLQKIDECYLPVAGDQVGPLDANKTTIGYRLKFDGTVVSGPETVYWQYFQAKEHCLSMIKANAGTQVECLFNGEKFSP